MNTVRPAGQRTIPLADFYDTLGPVIEPDELVTEIRIPVPAADAVQRFLKFRLRPSVDFAVVSVAAVLDMAESVCRDARLVLGAVAPVPYRAVAAEDVLREKPLDEKQAVQAAQAALSEAKPMSGNAYKIEIAKTLVQRVLQL